MTKEPLDRRAFLRLTVRGKERVLDLSCERLYVRWVNARAGVGSAAGASFADGAAAPPCDGEPLLDVVVPGIDDVLAELDGRLQGAHVLRVSGREWLADEGFRGAVESRIEAFRRRGGRVE